MARKTLSQRLGKYRSIKYEPNSDTLQSNVKLNGPNCIIDCPSRKVLPYNIYHLLDSRREYKYRWNSVSSNLYMNDKYFIDNISCKWESDHRVFCCDFSQNGNVLCCATQDFYIHLIDTESNYNEWKIYKQVEANFGGQIISVNLPEERIYPGLCARLSTLIDYASTNFVE